MPRIEAGLSAAGLILRVDNIAAHAAQHVQRINCHLRQHLINEAGNEERDLAIHLRVTFFKR
jgi:hypothetical protein